MLLCATDVLDRGSPTSASGQVVDWRAILFRRAGGGSRVSEEVDETVVWRCSTTREVDDSSEKSLKSEILAIERVCRMGWSSMLLRSVVVARRFAGGVVDMVVVSEGKKKQVEKRCRWFYR